LAQTYCLYAGIWHEAKFEDFVSIALLLVHDLQEQKLTITGIAGPSEVAIDYHAGKHR